MKVQYSRYMFRDVTAPVSLDQALHLLCLPLNPDLSLEFPQSFIQLHP